MLHNKAKMSIDFRMGDDTSTCGVLQTPGFLALRFGLSQGKWKQTHKKEKPGKKRIVGAEDLNSVVARV